MILKPNKINYFERVKKSKTNEIGRSWKMNERNEKNFESQMHPHYVVPIKWRTQTRIFNTSLNLFISLHAEIYKEYIFLSFFIRIEINSEMQQYWKFSINY